MQIFRYKVCLYDEEKDSEVSAYGVTAACSGGEAIMNIEHYYGKELLSSTIMYDEDNDGVLEFYGDEDKIKGLWEDIAKW